jgi:hypothetical protein
MAEQADLALIAEADAVTGCEFLRRLHQRLPARAVEALDQRRLDLGFGLAADAAALELRRDHLGIVDDELVARLQPLRQLGNELVTQRATFHDQHLRGVARARRAQRDPFWRKLEVEEISTHVSCASKRRKCVWRSDGAGRATRSCRDRGCGRCTTPSHAAAAQSQTEPPCSQDRKRRPHPP